MKKKSYGNIHSIKDRGNCQYITLNRGSAAARQLPVSLNQINQFEFLKSAESLNQTRYFFNSNYPYGFQIEA